MSEDRNEHAYIVGVIILVSRKNVAKLAGVSEATVSRVFNNVGPIREETKRKVLKAAKELNYYPNSIAQSFARRRSGNIGVIVPYFPKVDVISTYYFSQLLNGIGTKLGEEGYGLLLLFSPMDEPKDYLQFFLSQRVDGCIIIGSKNTPDEIKALEKLHHKNLPYCLLNQTFLDHPFHFLDANHYDGSFKAVSMLIKKGFQKVLFLNGPMEYSNSVDRLAGYHDAFANAELTQNTDWIFHGNYSRKSGLLASEKIGPLIKDFKAIFAGNDRMAIGLMQGLGQQGYQVGKDYVIIGYDDSDLSKITTPTLSTVKVPLFDMGYLAAEKVVQLLSSDEKRVIQERLSVTVIERESSHMNLIKGG
ncbi:LacI family DNA-binding transcriptional regulator [Peribacillus sp. JNUCC 23]